MDFSDYGMNESHDRILHQIIGTPLDADLPDKLLAKYWQYKRCCDRSSIRVTEQDLARFCAECGYGDDKPKEAQNIVDAWRAGDVPRDTPVTVQWGQGERSGLIKNVTAAGDVILILDGEGEERRMKAAKVRVAELATA